MAKQATYKIICEDIRSQVFSSRFLPGSRMDTEPEMAKHYNVSVGTVRKAVDCLVKENILSRLQGKGTYVNKSLNIKLPAQDPKGANNLKKEIGIAYGMSFYGQDVISKLLFKEELHRNEFMLSPEPSDWDKECFAPDCDLIQIATVQLHLKTVESIFEPFPMELKARVQNLFEEKILDEHCSIKGEILTLPLAANMSVIYANSSFFKKLEMELPLESLSFDDFIKLCVSLKKHFEFPAMICPAAGLLYEPLLKASGGAYFDKYGELSFEYEPFSRMIDFLRKLYLDKLIVNACKVGKSYPYFVKKEKVCMVLHNQLFNHLAGDDFRSWHALPWLHDKDAGGAFATIGIGVNRRSQNKPLAWNTIEHILDSGFERFSQNSMEFPAPKHLQKKWNGAMVNNESAFLTNLNNSASLPSRKNFWEWNKEAYFLFEQAYEGKLNVKQAWEKTRKIITENVSRIESGIFAA